MDLLLHVHLSLGVGTPELDSVFKLSLTTAVQIGRITFFDLLKMFL